MQAVIDAGLMRAWVPKAYGGLEMDPLTAVRMFMDLSRIDSATGWVVSQCSIFAYLGLLFPPATNREFYSDPRAVFAGGWWPLGKADAVPGGYLVNGQWSFNSGCEYATWLQGQVIVTENGTPRTDANGNPVAAVVAYPAREAEILDTWNTLGMRGTGSNDCRVRDLFVPQERVWLVSPILPPDPAFDGPLYRMGVWINAPSQSCVALGVARAALEEFLSLAETKTPSYQTTGAADRPLIQDRVARAEAAIEAAESYLERSIERAWEFVLGGSKIDIEHGMQLALAGCYAHEAACQAVDLIHSCAGTTAIRNEHRFQQHFRDVHTLSQHAFTGAARYESLGKLLLGRETDWPFYYL
jgi:alkylation response protein AidB-like acyl-CoA dehydrogenase